MKYPILDETPYSKKMNPEEYLFANSMESLCVFSWEELRSVWAIMSGEKALHEFSSWPSFSGKADHLYDAHIKRCLYNIFSSP